MTAAPPTTLHAAQAAYHEGRPDAAARLARAWLRDHPGDGTAWHVLGVALAGDTPDAATPALRRAVCLMPGNPEALRNLAVLLKTEDTLTQRIACYRHSLVLERTPYTLSNLSAALMDLGEPAQARAAAHEATVLLPSFLPAWINLGHAATAVGALEDAAAAYRQALALHPGQPDALHGLGALFMAARRFEEAAQVLAEAEAARPDDPKIGALAVRARQQTLDWSRATDDQRALLGWARQEAVGLPPFNVLSLPGIDEATQLATARRHATVEFAALCRPFAGPPPRPVAGRALRVGYVSADLRHHVIGRLMQGVLAHHDPGAVVPFVYDLWPDAPDTLTRSLQAATAAWVCVADAPLQDIAARMTADNLDVLIDMSGYTGHGRSGILAFRPAPVQVSYLGFPGSLGDRRLVDYILADPTVLPAASVDHYAETPALLPGSFLPPILLPDRPSLDRRALGLPETGLVLAAFHNAYKLNAPWVRRWSVLLQAVPDAVLWVHAPTASLRTRLPAVLKEAGISGDRIVLYDGGSYEAYLAALSLADLFLDTQPYSAGGTARDALAVGVPLVTCRGETFAGRMAAGACIEAGVGACVAETPDDYETLAVRLCQDSAWRTALRTHLRRHQDAAAERLPTFVRAFEALLRAMVDRAAQGLAPAPLQAHALPEGTISVVLSSDPAPPSPTRSQTSVSPSPEPPIASDGPSAPLRRTVLHVGCGPSTKKDLPAPLRGDEWREVRYDIDPSARPDILGSITDLSALSDASIDVLYSSHNIEHLFAHEVPQALSEFRRVLTPQGIAIVTCPDLQALGSVLADGRLLDPLYDSAAGPISALDILYGHRPSLQKGNPHMAHKVGFTGTVLLQTLMSCGFAAVTGVRVPDTYALWAVGFCWPATEEEKATVRRLYLPQ